MQGCLETLGQSLLNVGAHFQPVDHHVDVVLLVLLQFGWILEFRHDAIDAGPDVATGLEFAEYMQMFALAVAHQWRQHHQPRAFGHGQHLVDHLADGLCLQFLVMGGAVRVAHAGKQQAQIIVNLGDGADGGARVVRCGLLFDRDGGGKPFDVIDVRLVHHRQELPRVRRQGLDIAALTFGIECVECQRRLARTRESGNHNQLVPRDGDVDVLQVMGACPSDDDLVHTTPQSRQREKASQGL